MTRRGATLNVFMLGDEPRLQRFVEEVGGVTAAGSSTPTLVGSATRRQRLPPRPPRDGRARSSSPRGLTSMDDAPGPVCPFEIAHPVMEHRWDQLTFPHRRHPADTVQRLLPPSLTVDTYDGSAWVGLVPFLMEIGLPGHGPLPAVGRFCETNVRTYVVNEQGRRGIWFFSLDATGLSAVVAARTTYRLPYCWSQMRVVKDGDLMRNRPPPPMAGPRAQQCGGADRGSVRP